MFWIALELSIPKIGLNIMISLTVKKLDAFKFDGVAESDNTAWLTRGNKANFILHGWKGLFSLKIFVSADTSVP